MKDTETVAIEETRDEAVEFAIAHARLEARIDDEAVQIWVCVGAPCLGSGSGCAICDLIVVMPDGSVRRDTVRH